MSPDSIFRDAAARNAALERYSKAHDRFAELEQRLVHEGKAIEAAGAHTTGLIALRAWDAEQRDPEPPEATHA